MPESKLNSIQVQLFAGAAEAADARTLEISLPADSIGLAEFVDLLVAEHPQLDALARHSRYAIGTQFIDEKTIVPAGSALAMIPPVSGG